MFATFLISIQGVYGLTEAVQEIKECKKQIGIRDRNVEKLTQNVNRLELQVNDLLEENEELRSRLGLDPKEPIDLVELRNTKTFQNQQDRAMNQVLNQEVERLEAERLELKKIIRSLATKRAQRYGKKKLFVCMKEHIDQVEL